jgi:hypothetical protein
MTTPLTQGIASAFAKATADESLSLGLYSFGPSARVLKDRHRNMSGRRFHGATVSPIQGDE